MSDVIIGGIKGQKTTPNHHADVTKAGGSIGSQPRSGRPNDTEASCSSAAPLKRQRRATKPKERRLNLALPRQTDSGIQFIKEHSDASTDVEVIKKAIRLLKMITEAQCRGETVSVRLSGNERDGIVRELALV